MKNRLLDLSTTIFALSSGKLPSAIAVVRLSGPLALSITEKLTGSSTIRTRGMYRLGISTPQGEFIDDCMVLAFPGPASFTGQDVVEFQCHGSIPVVDKLEQTLFALGAIPAEKGEFSYRAYMNGKLAAAQVEKLADVYLAKDTSDLKSIYLRFDEATQADLSRIRETAIGLQAILDTAIDFSDEYSSVTASALAPIGKLHDECSWMLSRYSRFRLEREIPRLVLAGRPNAGKSSLFNAILCRYRAIVHSEAGTTRDVIEEDFDLAGTRWKLVDTAGLRDTSAYTEAQGIEIARRYLKNAAIWLLVVDGTHGLTAEDEQLLREFESVPHLLVWNKTDETSCQEAPAGAAAISARAGTGMSELLERLTALAPVSAESNGAFLPSSSQAKRLESVLAKLHALRTMLEESAPPEYLAEESRQVLSLLEDLVGFVDPEIVLDRVFSDFCIGK